MACPSSELSKQRSLTLFLLILALLAASASPAEASRPQCVADLGPVEPTSPLVTFLERVQAAALGAFGGGESFNSKIYLDLSLKRDLSQTERAFDRLMASANGSLSEEKLKGFLRSHFEGAGKDLVYHEPEDFTPVPEGFLPKVMHRGVRRWALEVHSLWKNLSRKVSPKVQKMPERHTLIPVPSPFIIPGSLYIEVYYWDSYWVVRGLLASKMYKTAKAIVLNLIFMLEKYGHVLNGNRIYYSNRSQPPLLSAMIREIYRRTGDVELIKMALPPLLKEYEFWNSDLHKVTILDAQGCTHTLNRYNAMWNKPRPETATFDKESASSLSSTCQKEHFYRELASAAESGWDFGARWMRKSPELTTLATTSILPVDLNAFILQMELDIAFMANITGDMSTAKHFLKASYARKKALNSVLWDEKAAQWFDYWLDAKTSKKTYKWKPSNQNRNIYASNFVPLWIELFNSDVAVVEKVIKSFKSSGLFRANGIATSLTNTGEQWDFPNGWSPLQHMIAEGLTRSGLKEARALAEDIVIRWIRTNLVAYKKNGVIYEKYNTEECGESGGTGQYVSQTGFGWSNGVILAFLEEHGWPKDRTTNC